MTAKQFRLSMHICFASVSGIPLRSPSTTKPGHDLPRCSLHIGGGGRKQKQDDKKPALSLYNLSKDIGETTDVAAENEKIVQRMYKRAQTFDKALKADARPPGEVKSGDDG